MVQYEVYWVTLDPAVGSEQGKRRPCAIVSPDDINEFLSTVIVVPITSKIKGYKYRVECVIDDIKGELMCEQIKTVSEKRFGPKICDLTPTEAEELRQKLKSLLFED